MNIISDLCSEEFTGRQSGTEGCEKSAAYISSTMEQIGLVPSSIDNQESYFQSFPVPYIQINNDTLCKHITDDTYTFQYKNEFYPYIKSDSGSIETEAVFVGYGIEMGKYDDYEGVDVENKIVVILRDNPSFLNLAVGSKATFDHKIYVAKKHKASGILILDLPNHKTHFSFTRKLCMILGKQREFSLDFLRLLEQLHS